MSNISPRIGYLSDQTVLIFNMSGYTFYPKGSVKNTDFPNGVWCNVNK